MHKRWREGRKVGNWRASPQRDTAVQTNELATVLLSCSTGTSLELWGFLQRQTQAMDQSHQPTNKLKVHTDCKINGLKN